MSAAISVEDVWKRFRLYQERNQYLKAALLRGRRTRHEEFWALKDVSLEVREGSTFGIIGSNGSGKSTLLKCLAGILVPDRGRLDVNGRMSALLELGAGFHPEMSGRENIFLNGAILGMSSSEILNRFDDIVSFSGLGSFVDVPVKNYSSGMVVRLGFAIAANVEPEILLIDEVLAVGDASFQQRCYEKIEEFRRDGRTIVLVSHGLEQVEQMCDHVAWIDKGEVREIGQSYEVVSSYQGNSHNARKDAGSEHGQRWGSGEIEIISVKLLSDGIPSDLLSTNSPMSIQIQVDAHQPVPNPVVGIRVTHLHGMNVWGTNTKRRGFSIPALDGPATITLHIDRLPLLEGTYDLTVAVNDSAEVHPFDHWEKRVRFDVHQTTTFDEGLVRVDAQWSIDSARPQLT